MARGSLRGTSVTIRRPLIRRRFLCLPLSGFPMVLGVESVEVVALWSIRRLEKGHAALYPRPARSPGS